MKKLMIAVAVVMLAVVSAKAEFFWSTWNSDDVANKNVTGCVLGLASEINTLNAGAQIDLVVSKAKYIHNGVQGALFVNCAKSASLQLGLLCWNETGFLPFFVFFNFDPAMFGSSK